MHLFEKGAYATPIRAVLDGLLVIVGLLVAADVLLVAVLLADPHHTARELFQVTTLVRVPPEVWPSEHLVRVTPGTADVAVDAWAFLTYRPTGRAFVAGAAFIFLPWWACVVVALLQLRGVLTSISAAGPFARENVRRIRNVGLAILASVGVDFVIDLAMFAYMRTTTTVAGRPPIVPMAILVVDFPLGTILAGLAVVILAGIFRVGADLQEDQALTV